MTRLQALLAVVAAIVLAAPAVARAEPGEFAGARADTTPRGRVELGVIEPLRWGVTDAFELYTQPILALAVPHVGAVIAWTEDGPWRISTRHEIAYPSLGLGLVAREGAGGFLPASQEIPQLVVVDTEVLMTTTIPLTRRFITVALGAEVAPRLSGPPVVIEAPIFYPRTAVYTSGVVGHARFTFSGELPWSLHFEVSATGFFLPEVRGFVAEQEGWLGWGGSSFRVRAGLFNSTGWYPFGVRAHRLPLVDLMFGF